MIFKAGKLVAALTAAGIITGTVPYGAVGNAQEAESFNWIDYADTSWYSEKIFASSNPRDYCIDISTPEQLAGIAKLVNDGKDIGGLIFNLVNDIVLDEDLLDGNIKEWTPIGADSENPFVGVFNGNGYTIYGLNITEHREYNGLFGYVANSQIKNLALTDGEIASGKNIGAFSGSSSETSFEDCLAELTMVTVKNNDNTTEESICTLGGIVGNSEGSEYNNCISLSMIINKTVCAENSTGGIVGASENDEFDRCASSGIIGGNSENAVINSGGICGKAIGSKIGDSFSRAAVTATNGRGNSGGIVGLAEADDKITVVDKCISRGGAVLSKSTGYAGGITGFGGSVTASCCVGFVQTNVAEGSVIGGIAGAAADIENCYSFSTIDCSLPDEKDENGFVIEGEKKKDTNLKGNIIGEKSESDKLIDTYYIDGNERTERESVGAVGNDEAFNILKRGNTDEEIMSAEFAELLGENFCKVDNYCPFVKGYRFIDEIENAGDANEDGCVDIFDVNAVKNYLIYDDCSLNPLGKSLADVDNQKGITISDAVRIKEYIVGLNPEMWHDGVCGNSGGSISGSGSINVSANTTITEIDKDDDNESELDDIIHWETIS